MSFTTENRHLPFLLTPSSTVLTAASSTKIIEIVVLRIQRSVNIQLHVIKAADPFMTVARHCSVSGHRRESSFLNISPKYFKIPVLAV